MDSSKYPPPPPYTPSAPGPQGVPQQVIVVSQVPLGPKSAIVVCPSCHKQCSTTIRYSSNFKTHLIALVLLVTTFLCCLPYCIDSCQNADHYCSGCGAYLGTYSS